jgi:Cu2+-exporting ATPase
LAGWLPPLAAGIGMAASSLFVVLNSQRLAR